MRDIDLQNYLPPFMLEYLEMNCLLNSENIEFRNMSKKLRWMLDEFFIVTATDEGLSRFEKILKLHPASSASLETRRSAIITRWYDTTPYTIKALKNKIIAIQGNDEVEVNISTERPYEIEIITNLENPGQVNDLKYIIQTMIPANMVIYSFNTIKGQSETTLGYGVGASITGNLLLTNDLNENQNVPVPVGIAVGHSVTNTLFLTDSINKNIDVAGVAAIGMGSSFTNIIVIT